jgi:XTP/dITP diphosphohydrolase
VKLLLATRNKKKLAELQRILDAALGPGVAQLVSLDDVPAFAEVPESGLTFEENALIKAREGAQQTGLPTIADDSGLCVDALSGMPGVLSARWAGKHGSDEDNLRLVLDQIGDLPDSVRGAQFRCVAALVHPDGREWTVDGEMTGVLARAPRGTGGFGYDPIFVASGHSMTNAELAPAAKDEISHRGKAFRRLADLIRRELG